MTWSPLLLKKLALAVAVIVMAGLLLALIGSRVPNEGTAGNAGHIAASGQDFASGFKLFYPFTESRALAPMTFYRVQGQPIKIEDYRGRYVLLHFWATWCAPCARELPLLERFQIEMAGKNLAILPVSVDFDKPMPEISEFMQKNGVETLPAIVGEQNEGIWQVVSGGLPASFIIGPDGRILYKMIGEADWTSKSARAFFDDILENN